MKLSFVHWDNFRYLTGLSKAFASVVNEVIEAGDRAGNGAFSGFLRALAQDGGEVYLPPGNLRVQYDEETREYGYWYDSLASNPETAALYEQGQSKYGSASGAPFTLMLVAKRGEFYSVVTVPLGAVLRTAPDISDKYQVYSHDFCCDENGAAIAGARAYIGVTKRGWRTRWQEHVRSAERGSRYRFHQAIRYWDGRAKTVGHHVIAVGQTEAQAMALEEQMVGLETLHPKGLNMIPGGYAGLKYLRQIGAAGVHERVTPDDKQEIVNRFFETASRKGLPNPLAAANWCDPSYAEKVICAGDDRLKPNQIRNARFLASLGKSTDDIVVEIGALNKPQVQRLLSGSTYSRVA